VIDFIVRDCGAAGFLPIIKVCAGGKELYRGEHYKTLQVAWYRMMAVWAGAETQRIQEWKGAHQ